MKNLSLVFRSLALPVLLLTLNAEPFDFPSAYA